MLSLLLWWIQASKQASAKNAADLVRRVISWTSRFTKYRPSEPTLTCQAEVCWSQTLYAYICWTWSPSHWPAIIAIIGLGTDQRWSTICVSLPTLTGNLYRCADCAGSAWRSSLHTYSQHDPKQHKTAQVGDPSPTSTIKSETWHIVALGTLPEIVVNSCAIFFLSWAG